MLCIKLHPLKSKMHPLKSKMHPPLNRNCTPYRVSIKIRVICHESTVILDHGGLFPCLKTA